MNISVDEPVLAALRRTTRTRHLLLESILQLVQPLTRLRYMIALTGFDLFLATWEPLLAAALPASLRDSFKGRSRHMMVRRDLSALGSPIAIAPELITICEHAARNITLDTRAAAFGSLYVLEGSALGGQVIAKAARDVLGLGPDNGAAYFNGSQRDTAAGWGAFRTLLEQQVGTRPKARHSACVAAQQTFDALIYTFAIVRGHAHVA